MKTPLTILTLLLLSSRVFSQSADNFSKTWILGAPENFKVIFDGSLNPVTAIDTGAELYLNFGHSSICDSFGNLLLFSIGGIIFNRHHQIIQNGDSVIPNIAYDHYYGECRYTQAGIFLPFEDSTYYYVVATGTDDNAIHWPAWNAGPDLILYDVIDMKANGGAGKVVKKNLELIKGDSMSFSQMGVCRHGNGKDWWLLKQGLNDNTIYKFLITKDTAFGPYVQYFDEPIFGYGSWSGQSVFSQDGTKYATTARWANKIFVADFDRCSGLLSNPKTYYNPLLSTHDPFFPEDVHDSVNSGLAFSLSGQFLYLTNEANIQQLDLLDTSSSSQWYTVAGMDTTLDQFQHYCGIQIGIDGKEYIGNLNVYSSQMSVIDSPDNKGAACGFCPRCLVFPPAPYGDTVYNYFVSQPPNMANYALGPDPDCSEAVNHVVTKAAVVRIYPNPSSGNITIEYPAAGSIEISNAMGQVLFATTLSSLLQSERVDLGKLPTGIYTYRYLSADGKIQKAGKLSLVQ